MKRTMTDKAELRHYKNLLEFVRNPESIGVEEPLVGYLVEPVWFDRKGDENSLCDIIFMLEGNLAIPTEVKSSDEKRDKAIKQVEEGRKYSEGVLYRKTDRLIIAYYRDGNYEVLK